MNYIFNNQSCYKLCVDGLFVNFNDCKHNAHESPKIPDFQLAVLFSTLGYRAR